MIRKALSCIATILLLYAFVAVPDQSTEDQTTHYFFKK